MSIPRLSLLALIKLARTDMLATMDLIRTDAPLAKVGFGVPLVVAQQFSSAQHVLVADAESYRKPWMIRRVIEEGLGKNLFTTDGDEWLARRQPCAPAFGIQQMETLAALMAQTVAEASEAWQPGEIDIKAATNDLAIKVALRGLLGVSEDNSDLATQVATEFEEILDWITFRFNHPLSMPAAVPTKRNRRLATAKTNLHQAMERLIKHRRDHDDGSVDILSQLVRAQTNNTHDLSDAAIVDECIGFMFAGHETTASTLAWSLYELALRPDLQDAVAQEGSQLRIDSGSLMDEVQAMQQTQSVVEETLRMYPAGISIVRSAKRSTHIGDTKVRRGTMVMIPVYAIQRSPLIWDNPNDFDPTRDHDGNGEGFLPFGLGPRRCLGARFARTELNIALGLICSSWTFAYDQVSPPKPIVAPSLQAEGELKLTIAKRATQT